MTSRATASDHVQISPVRRVKEAMAFSSEATNTLFTPEFRVWNAACVTFPRYCWCLQVQNARCVSLSQTTQKSKTAMWPATAVPVPVPNFILVQRLAGHNHRSEQDQREHRQPCCPRLKHPGYYSAGDATRAGSSTPLQCYAIVAIPAFCVKT